MTRTRRNRDLYSRFVMPVGLTWAALLAERLLQAFWPLLSFIGIVYALIAISVGLVSSGFVLLTLIPIGVILIFLLFLGVRKFRLPKLGEAQKRLDSTLPGRPIETLLDLPVMGAGEETGKQLWQAHVRRTVDETGPVRAVGARPGLPAKDPLGFRLASAWLFFVAVLFVPVPTLVDLAPKGVLPSGGVFTEAASWEAWVEPPVYTRQSPVYLNDLSTDLIQVPVGSELTIRSYGREGEISVEQSVSTVDTSVSDGQVSSFIVGKSGRITIDGPQSRSFQIVVTEDKSPQISANDPIERKNDGTISIPFAATDDYGIVGGKATVSLDLEDVERVYGLLPEPDEREALVLDLPMPFAGDRRSVQQVLAENLGEHPWAGLPVNVTLEVSDDVGQTGSVDLIAIQMPRRQFFDPLATAIVEQRRDLLWSVENAGRVVQVLRAVSHRPEGVFDSETAYLMLRTAVRRLDASQRHGAVSAALRNEIAEALWGVALKIEDGNLQDALDRLRLAQDRLEEAIENGASEEELAELMEELRQAMQDYMEQLAQRGGEDDENFANRQMTELSGEQLDEMMDRMEELMEQGKRAEAQDLLNQLRRMTENLQMAQGDRERGENAQSQRAIEELTETMRRQQALNDQTFQQLQESQQGGDRSGEGQQGQAGNNDSTGSAGSNQGSDQALNDQRGGGGQPGEGAGDGRGGSAEAGLADQQQGLRSQLESQTEAMPEPGSEPGRAAREALNDAGRAMEGAEGDLRQGDLSGALQDQAQAMEALREGMRQMAEEMQQNAQGRGQQGEAVGQTAPNPTRDPLGRQSGNQGLAGTDEQLLGEQDQQQRALELIDQIQRRSADQDRPLKEREYLKRLIEQF